MTGERGFDVIVVGAGVIGLSIAHELLQRGRPGTPFFFEVVKNGWFREGTKWEQVDMDKGTVLDYENLSAERLLYWQKQAFREWAFRPGPILTYMKMLLYDLRTFKTALNVGMQTLRWQTSSSE